MDIIFRVHENGRQAGEWYALTRTGDYLGSLMRERPTRWHHTSRGMVVDTAKPWAYWLEVDGKVIDIGARGLRVAKAKAAERIEQLRLTPYLECATVAGVVERASSWMREGAKDAAKTCASAALENGLTVDEMVDVIAHAQLWNLAIADHAQRWTGYPLGRAREVNAEDLGRASWAIKAGFRACAEVLP